MTAEQRAQVIPVADRMVATFALTSQGAAAADPVFRRCWDEGVRYRMPRAVPWLAERSSAIEAAL